LLVGLKIRATNFMLLPCFPSCAFVSFVVQGLEDTKAANTRARQLSQEGINSTMKTLSHSDKYIDPES
jgi:hypothetical protein